MNRRNFLKLLGLTALPIPALAAVTPAPTVEPTVSTDDIVLSEAPEHFDWLILETPYRGLHRVEVDNEGVEGQYSYVARNHDAVYYDHGKGTSQFLKVTEQSRIIVTSPSGQLVWFRPQWDAVYERFETVVISDDDTTILESKVTTMTARNTDGKLITKSIMDVTV